MNYKSNLTDAEWQAIEKFFNIQRKRDWDLRTQIIDAIFYLLRTGCQWRMLPKEFAPWQTVYYYFRKWKKTGVWEKINEALRRQLRKEAGKYISPSLGMVDSQSVASGVFVHETKGVDGNKKIKGRKRHIIVDTMGSVLNVKVTAANSSDKEGFKKTAKGLKSKFWRLKKILADGAYEGAWHEDYDYWEIEIVKKEQGQKGFKVQPKRWVVERTFGWFEHYRRLSKDYEFCPKTSETMIYMAMCRMMLRKIA